MGRKMPIWYELDEKGEFIKDENEEPKQFSHDDVYPPGSYRYIDTCYFTRIENEILK